MSVLDTPELRTAEEALRKYKAPWYYDDALGDILDAGGHYIMSCYDLGIAEIVLRGANEHQTLSKALTTPTHKEREWKRRHGGG